MSAGPTERVSIDSVTTSVATTTPFFLAFPHLYHNHTLSSPFPLLFAAYGKQRVLVKPWATLQSLAGVTRFETEELSLDSKAMDRLAHTAFSAEFQSFFGMTMVRALLQLQNSTLGTSYSDVVHRLLLELPLLDEEPFHSALAE